jgi:hypothetical protein
MSLLRFLLPTHRVIAERCPAEGLALCSCITLTFLERSK